MLLPSCSSDGRPDRAASRAYSHSRNVSDLAGPGGAAVPVCEDARMRLTDFWERMEAALGAAYARSWAADVRLAALGNRTVMESLSQGEDTKTVWRAVHAALNLPSSDR